MIELLTYLRASGFKTYIVSGGTVEFMRPWTERTYGIPPEQVMGTSFLTTYQLGTDGKPSLLRQPKIDFIDDGPASRSASRNSSAVGRCSPSATPTATSR